MYDRVKGPPDQVALAGMKKGDFNMMYKELMDDACNHVHGGLSLTEFYAKHEHAEARRNVVIRYGGLFSNLWKNYPLLKQVKKPEYSLEQSL